MDVCIYFSVPVAKGMWAEKHEVEIILKSPLPFVSLWEGLKEQKKASPAQTSLTR